MAKTTIRVDARAPMTSAMIPFFTFCVDWTHKLESLLGGVSVEITVTDQWSKADIHWRGKPLLCLMTSQNPTNVDYMDDRNMGSLSRKTIDKSSLWESVLQPILIQKVAEEIYIGHDKLSAVKKAKFE